VVEEGTRDDDVVGLNPSSREVCEKCCGLHLAGTRCVVDQWGSPWIKNIFSYFLAQICDFLKGICSPTNSESLLQIRFVGAAGQSPLHSAISSNGVAGRLPHRTVARNGLVPPLKMQSDVVLSFFSPNTF
jgi:hypothetical protein